MLPNTGKYHDNIANTVNPTANTTTADITAAAVLSESLNIYVSFVLESVSR
jgi:hypothetical protein